FCLLECGCIRRTVIIRETTRIDCDENAAMNVRINIEVRSSRRLNRQRIYAKPARHRRGVESLAEIVQADFNILFFATKPIVFAQIAPATRPIIAVCAAVPLVRALLDEFAGSLVEHCGSRAEVVADFKQHMLSRSRCAWHRWIESDPGK